MRTYRSQSGFTLMELMIVAAVLAVLMMAAVPIYQDYVNTARANTHIDNFDEAKRLVAAECAKSLAGGVEVNIVTELNDGNPASKRAVGNENQPAFVDGAATGTEATDAGVIYINGLAAGQVSPGTPITISAGALAVGTTPAHYRTRDAAGAPGLPANYQEPCPAG
ncbi:MAG: prepilin-type N-terminal cleavage/methylation domain-containing protein [Gammaproteobacteria bacterium]|nr:prepilin-type N-terminal cleavage/methylation domain-containing protein [Gammaproteobacteria bacterium]